MNPNKRKSLTQEKKVAKEMNAKTVVASGALWGSKGDIRSDKFLIEAKVTAKSSYRLTFLNWNKIRLEAIKDGGRIPVFVIDLEDGLCRLVVVDSSYFNRGSAIDCVNFSMIRGDVKSILISKAMSFAYDVFTPVLTTVLFVFSWDLFLEMEKK